MNKFHLALPGPIYWDFQCLVCDGDVRGHFTRQIKLAKERRLNK